MVVVSASFVHKHRNETVEIGIGAPLEDDEDFSLEQTRTSNLVSRDSWWNNIKVNLVVLAEQKEVPLMAAGT